MTSQYIADRAEASRSIKFQGITFKRGLFMSLQDKAHDGIDAVCSWCGDPQSDGGEDCSCGHNSYVCTVCSRALWACTCPPEVDANCERLVLEEFELPTWA